MEEEYVLQYELVEKPSQNQYQTYEKCMGTRASELQQSALISAVLSAAIKAKILTGIAFEELGEVSMQENFHIFCEVNDMFARNFKKGATNPN